MEAMSHIFDHGGIVINDWFSDKLNREKYLIIKLFKIINHLKFFSAKKIKYLFIAFNISIVTSTDNAIVMGWGSVKILQLTPLNSSPPPMQAKW